MVMRIGMAALVVLLVRVAAAQQLPVFDFKDPKAAQEWKGNRDISELKLSHEGLEIVAKGRDPFITGPARNFPADQLLLLHIKVKCEVGGELQVFYFKKGASETDSIKADVSAEVWEDLYLRLPALGPGYRLRIDPPGDKGTTVLAKVEFEKREVLAAHAWPKPVAGKIEDPLEVKALDLTLKHSRTRLGEFEIWSHDKRMAIGGGWGEIGYVIDGKQRWVVLSKADVVAREFGQTESLVVLGSITDQDGGKWQIDQQFFKQPSGILVQVSAKCDKDRDVIFLPMFFLFPGVETFGEKKWGAIFPGLEYLDEDEPSSSSKDIEGPGSQRQVPYTSKITIPMMGINNDLLYLGMMWDQSSSICAVFDSPDRLFKSGGHVMGLMFPSARPQGREESNLLPIRPAKLSAGSPVTLNATLVGGIGTNISQLAGDWLMHHKLPLVPEGGPLGEYVKTASAGWLDSKINEGGIFRHAFPGAFGAHPAGDAVAMIDWLEARCKDPQLTVKLLAAQRLARSKLAPGDVYSSVGHIKTPAPVLLYGDAADAAARASQQGRELLKRCDEKGHVIYDAHGGLDLARTHDSRHANGLTANVVVGVLEAAALSGDRVLLEAGLARLRQLQRYGDQVPRGAQTWEVPLHTPDILAAAHLVRAFTLGYQLTGDKQFEYAAIRWAEAGLPFVYLRDPTDQRVGPYATIAVFGATQWKAPNWMGQPVQWCGLVYADALYRMAATMEPGKYKDTWIQIADGITASGIQQTWPLGMDAERQGLLPDSFKLQSQTRVDVAINPATLQVAAARFYRQVPLYSFYVYKGVFVHVPGDVIKTEEAKEALWLKVRPCVKGECSILICGFKKRPRVTVNAAPPEKDAVKFVEEGGRLVIKLRGESSVLLEDL